MVKVLVTGAAGAIGVPVCRELLLRGHEVRAFDLRVPSLGLHPPDARLCWIEGGIEDSALVREATRGCDAVVHLAAVVHDAPFDELVGPNVRGLFNVLDAARRAGGTRVALASSIQAVSRPYTRAAGPISVREHSPSNHYGLTKVWAEQMGEMYARCHGLSVVAVRIAFVVRDATEVRRMVEHQAYQLYLSHADVARCFALAVDAKFAGFETVYAIGPEGAAIYDPEPARRVMGFESRDVWPNGLGFQLPE